MGLFDKKYCDICGKEIKLLGNRKLDDGNMCKDCASKLSVWFSGRRHTSVVAIKEQLAYRERNAEDLKKFNPTRIIGKKYKVYIDENQKKFVVSNLSKWRESNPDIIDFKDVTDADVKIIEDRDEIYTEDENGKRVSYDPRRYEYEYEFRGHINVNNKFFDDMDFELTSDRPDKPYGEVYEEYLQMAKDLVRLLTGKEYQEERLAFTYSDENASATDGQWYCPKCGTRNTGNFCVKDGTPRPADYFKEFYCSKCGEKISDPQTAFCPRCGNKVR